MPLIPTERLANWTRAYTGVPGGIPTNRTNIINVKDTQSLDDTGGADCYGGIQAAINASSDGDVLYFPAGTYLIGGGTPASGLKKNFTIRGDGRGLTVFKLAGSSMFLHSGTGAQWGTMVTSTDDAKVFRGSNSLVFSDVSEMVVGDLLDIGIQNDYSIPVISLGGYDTVDIPPPTGGATGATRRQLVAITAVNSGTGEVTFFPPLYDDYGLGSLIIHAAPLLNTRSGIGIEDLEIDGTGGSSYSAIWLTCTRGSWVKNVYAHHCPSHIVTLDACVQCEVRDSNLGFQGSGGTNGAIVLMSLNTGTLVENNILFRGFPHVELNGSSVGCVFGYNLSKFTLGGEGMNGNHSPHNSYNLWEGNALFNHAGFIWDGWFGSASRDTVHRNLICGRIRPNRFTRDITSIGNITELVNRLGDPNAGNLANNGGTASLIGNNPWPDWYTRLIQPGTITVSGTTITASDPVFTQDQVDKGAFIIAIGGPNNGRVGTFTAFTSATEVEFYSYGIGDDPTPRAFKIIAFGAQSAMFKELDQDVEATFISKGDFCIETQGYSSLGGDTLPDSLYLTEKPSWFGNLNWPPIDATALQPAAEYPNDWDVPPTSMIRVGSLVTVIMPVTLTYPLAGGGLGWTDGMTVNIRGANETEYNGDFVISILPDLVSFTFVVTGTPSTPATGDIQINTQARIDAYREAAALIPAGFEFLNQEPPAPDDTVAKPTFSPAAGTYEGAQTITIACATPGEAIRMRYTTDGSEPSRTHGMIYTAPVAVADDAELKAIAYDESEVLEDSTVRSGSYVITEGHGDNGNDESMPAINLAQLFDFEGNFETAAQAILAANGITSFISQQAVKLPKISTGIAFDVSPALDQITQLAKPTNWPVGTPPPTEYFRYVATLEFRIQVPRDKNSTSYPGVDTLFAEFRGKIRSAFMRCVAPFNATNLPLYELGDLRPAGASTGWEALRNFDFCFLRFSITFAIKPTAWPAWIES